MQFLRLTIYLRGRWYDLRLDRDADAARQNALLTSDLKACLIALDPAADPTPRVLQVEFQRGYPSFIYDEVNRPHFEDFMGSCAALVMLPGSCNLVGLEERLRPHLAERFLHISERQTVAGELAQNGEVLKAGEAWLHTPTQAKELTGVALPVAPRFGPPDLHRTTEHETPTD